MPHCLAGPSLSAWVRTRVDPELIRLGPDRGKTLNFATTLQLGLSPITERWPFGQEGRVGLIVGPCKNPAIHWESIHVGHGRPWAVVIFLGFRYGR